MINRAAVILKYKKPAVTWINDADPVDNNPGITLLSANEDKIVYLIREEDAVTPEILNQWIKLNYKVLFESELEGWYTDEGLWPKNRDLNIFYEWFEIECHTVIEDTVDLPIENDET